VNKLIKNDCIEIYEEYKQDLKKLSGKKILITGGSGFLLSYLVYLLLYFNQKNKKKIDIHVIDQNTKKFSNLGYSKNLKLINTDISKKIKLKTNYSYIIHGASIASPVFYKKKPLETIYSNVNGLTNILESYKFSKKLKSIIFMSSSEVYGDPDKKNIPTKETYNGNVSCTGPRACYDESKRLGETISTIFYHKYKVPIKIIRPFNVYGPGQNLNDKRIYPDIMNSIKRGKNITLFSDGSPTRSFCYISDQIRGILEVLLSNKNGEAYNIGNTQEISMLNLAKLAIKLSKKKLKVKMKSNIDKNFNTDCPQRRCPDIKKIYKLNKWKPKIKLEKGLLRTLRYYEEEK
jgi:UDP-glucuronate decarboxylase